MVADAIYGGEQRALNDADTTQLKHALAHLKRQALHARLLGFEHPVTGENLTFSAPMPADMQCLVDALAKKNGAVVHFLVHLPLLFLQIRPLPN